MRANIFTIILVLFAGFVLYQNVPVMIRLYNTQGRMAPSAGVVGISPQQLVQIPQTKKQVLVFWATWCGPCKVELARINRLIKNKEIAADAVLAISVAENPALVAAFAKEHDYQFSVALDPDGKAARLYQVSGTPTIFLIDELGNIEWATMGLSPSLEVRIRTFF